jgi:hypothetical protein
MQLIRNDINILKFELTANFIATGYSAKLTIKNKSTNALFFTDTLSIPPSLDNQEILRFVVLFGIILLFFAILI